MAVVTSLLRYELLILWKGARAAFSGRRDAALLAVFALLVAAMLVQSGVQTQFVAGARAAPLVAKAFVLGLAGCAIFHSAAARLEHLRLHSVMARQALRFDAACAYVGAWCLPPLILGLAVLPGGAAPALQGGVLAAAFAAGAGAAAAVRAAWAAVRQWLARQRGRAARAPVSGLETGTMRWRVLQLVIGLSALRWAGAAGNLAVFFAAGAALAILYGTLANRDGEIVAWLGLLASLAVLHLTLRQRADLLRYLLFRGVAPAGPALVPLLLAASLFAGFLIAAWAMEVAQLAIFAAIAAGGLLVMAWWLLLRGFHHATKSRQAAEFAVQVDVFAVLVAGAIALPLAPLLILVRLGMLARAAAALRYVAR